MSSLWRRLRKHLHFVVISLALIIIMTWPTVLRAFESDEFWLPHRDWDTFIEVWDAWHVKRVLAGLSEFSQTEAQFYPVGLALNYHPFNVLHALTFTLLQLLWPTSTVYAIVYLLIVFLTALSGYVFFLSMFGDKWLALFGTVVFSMSNHVVGHAHHPGLGLLATIPLALYALHRGVTQSHWKWMIVCGVLAGLTIFVGPYTFICLMLSICLLALCFAISRWRRIEFWGRLAVMFLIAVMISSLRFVPMLQDQGEFAAALDKNRGAETANDLVASFVNYRHPVTTPAFVELFDIDTSFPGHINGWRHTSYLGYLPLLLTLCALVKSPDRRQLLPWLALLGVFFLLRLGSELRVNNVVHSGVFLPKHYLDGLFPPVFAMVHETDHFQIGLLIPLAVLSCIGLRIALNGVSQKYRLPLILAAIALVAFEYYYSPLSLVVPDHKIAFISWLRGESDQEEIRLINLPMGRHQSKLYGFHQTLHGYPHAEGLAMRTPASSYAYIHSNLLLNAWSNNRVALKCSFDNFGSYLPALRQLIDDGFSHIVLHRHLSGAKKLAEEFDLIDPAYQSNYTYVYRVPDLYDACANWQSSLENEYPQVRTFLQSSASRPQEKSTLLNFQPMDELSEDARTYFFRRLSDWGELLHVFDDGLGNVTAQTSTRGRLDLEDVQTEGRIIWIVYNPQTTDLQSSQRFSETLSPRLRSCQRLEESYDLKVDIRIDRDYPCALITDPDPFSVRYENDNRLQNLMHELDGSRFKLYLWFSDEPVRGFAYSIQVYDGNENRVLQLDDVIRNEPLSRHELDVSDLPPGQYRADLILYHSDSGKSEPGWVLATGQSFRRELEIARFTLAD